MRTLMSGGTAGGRALKLALLVLIVGTACKDEPGSYEQEPAAKAPSEPKKNVTMLKPPVDYGRKIPCATLLDAAKVGTILGSEVVLEDKSQIDKDATAVCRIRKGGTALSAKEQEKLFAKNDRVLGVLPGDELCQVTVYCAFAYTAEEMKQTCQKAGEEVSAEIGDVTCVKTLEAGAEYRTVVTALDLDTRCKLLVNPGPSVTDAATPKACAKAAVELISTASIQ